jgi:hypothetical protein
MKRHWIKNERNLVMNYKPPNKSYVRRLIIKLFMCYFAYDNNIQIPPLADRILAKELIFASELKIPSGA